MIGDIANAALQPQMGKIEDLVQGLALEGGGEGVAGPSYEVDLEHVTTHAAVMKSHAETVNGHVATFTENLRSLDFTS